MGWNGKLNFWLNEENFEYKSVEPEVNANSPLINLASFNVFDKLNYSRENNMQYRVWTCI